MCTTTRFPNLQGHRHDPGHTPRHRLPAWPPARVATLLFLLGLLPAGSVPSAASDLAFDPTVIDPVQSGDCKVLADLNGDGLDDAVVAGTLMKWYAAPDWTAHVIATAATEFTTDMEAADIDRDGDLDLVVPDGAAGVFWFENVSGGTTWTRHAVGATAGKYCHDVAVGDIDQDGDPDVVGRPLDGNLHLFRQEAGGAWTATSRATVAGEGLALADLDRDGRLDIIVNGQWHEAPDGSFITGTWPVHVYDAAKLSLSAKVAAADLNGDGRLDIALTPAEGLGEIAWYRAPSDPFNGSWTRQTILTSADRYHSLQLVDVDGDGRADLLTAQMHTATGSPVVAVYLNPGASGASWPRVVAAQQPSHNLAVGDVNADGRPDLLGCDYIGYPPVTIWINEPLAFSTESTPPRRDERLDAAPNPFNARVVLTVSGTGDAPATLGIYDLGGRLVRELARGVVLGDPGQATWDGLDQVGRRAPAGLYLAVLSAGSTRLTRKVALVP